MSAAFLLHNDMAVRAITEGNYSDAHGLLLSALREIRNIQMNPDDSILSIFGDLVVESVGVPHNGRADTDVFVFFNRALSLRHEQGPDAGSSGDDSQEGNCAKVVLVLFYNLGLTFQLWAAKDNLSGHATGALGFYRSAMEMIPLASLKNRDVLAVLALANNLGCVCLGLVDYEGASSCLAMIDFVYQATNATRILSEEDSIFFYMTTFVNQTLQLCAAPTA